MAKQNDRARQVKEAEIVAAAALIAGDEAPRVLEPGKEALDAPAASVSSKRAAVLGQVDAIAPMRGDEFDLAGGEGPVERVAVVGRVANEALRVVGEKAGV